MSYLSPNCQALGPQSPTQLKGNWADTKIKITVLLVPQTFPMCTDDRTLRVYKLSSKKFYYLNGYFLGVDHFGLGAERR